MRRGRDQADVALGLAARGVPAADGQQAGELPLGAGVGLDADRVVPGQLDEQGLEVGDQLARTRATARAGAKGWIEAKPGQLIGSISVVALSFIVHEPSGIIERSSATSYPARRRR